MCYTRNRLNQYVKFHVQLVTVLYQWSEDNGFESWLNLSWWGPLANPLPLPLHTKEVKIGTVMAVMALSVDQFCTPISSHAVWSLGSWDGIRNRQAQWSGVICAVDRAVSLDVDYNPARLPLLHKPFNPSETWDWCCHHWRILLTVQTTPCPEKSHEDSQP